MKKFQEMSESIQIDPSAMNDKYRWYEERGLDLRVLDAEDDIEWKEEELQKLRLQWRETRVTVNRDVKADLERICKDGERIKQDIRELEKYADSLWRGEEDEEVGECHTDSEVFEIWLKEEIKGFSLGQMATLVDSIDHYRSKENINWRTYVRAMCALTVRLAKATPERFGWWDDAKRFQKLNRGLEQSPAIEQVAHVVPSYAFSIEDAIDLKRAAERLADRHNLSLEEAFMILQEGDAMDSIVEEVEEWEKAPSYEMDMDNFFYEE